MFKQGYQTENRNTTWNKIVDITDLENLYSWTGKRLLLIVLWHLIKPAFYSELLYKREHEGYANSNG